MGFVVMIVEDDREMQERLRERFGGRPVDVVIQAYSLEEAISLFAENSRDIDGIIVDGTLTTAHSNPEGPLFIREVRAEGFTGPIVACSSSDPMNDMMIQDGATSKARALGVHAVKESGPSMLMYLLKKK